MSEMSSKIGSIVLECKQKEKAKTHLKEHILNLNIQSESFLKQYKDELHHAEIAKKISQNTLKVLQTRVEEKVSQINLIKNPTFFKTEVPKNFLASERLASSKKKSSLSPEKKMKKVFPILKNSSRNKSAPKIKRVAP